MTEPGASDRIHRRPSMRWNAVRNLPQRRRVKRAFPLPVCAKSSWWSKRSSPIFAGTVMAIAWQRRALLRTARRREIDAGVRRLWPAFDILALPMPDLAVDLDQRDLGGVGVPMLRALIDHASYRREDPRNMLRVIVHAAPRLRGDPAAS